MTLLLWIALGAVFNEKVGDLGLRSAQAAWEYGSSARPRKTKNSSAKRAESDLDSKSAPARVQVFGQSAATTADDYARMLREDAARNQEVDPDFEALRKRIRTRRTAENTGDTVPDAKPARKKTRRRATAKPKSTDIPPPPMETEVIVPQTAPAREAYASDDEVNAAFPYTHLLPSPFNLPGGSYFFGTSFAYGVFDSLELSTNLARTIQQQWNFRAKVPLIEYPTFIATAFVDYNTFNAHHYSETNPDEWTKRWQPGLVTGYEITPDIAFFLGGNFNFGKKTSPIMTTSGYLRGAQANMEWSYLYNPSSSRLGNNAISVGMNYDFTYSMFGFGLTHHWKAFELGVHYTFANENRFLPIFGFNVASSF
jgi:hypothetical protein